MFNKVVIKNTTQFHHNVWLAVYPFYVADMVRMEHKGHYGYDWDTGSISEWQKALADKLWDKLPGLQTIYFDNGEIILQHNGLFSDEEIIAAATEVIQPVLEDNLLLQRFKE